MHSFQCGVCKGWFYGNGPNCRQHGGDAVVEVPENEPDPEARRLQVLVSEGASDEMKTKEGERP